MNIPNIQLNKFSSTLRVWDNSDTPNGRSTNDTGIGTILSFDLLLGGAPACDRNAA